MTTNLEGAVVAVVGASGGLGAPIARRLAERGTCLVRPLAGEPCASGRVVARARRGAHRGRHRS